VIGAQLGLQNAGIAKGTVPPHRIGVEFASLMGASDLNDIAAASKLAAPDGEAVSCAVWGEKGLGEIAPLWMLKYLPNMAACHTTILYDIQGPSNTQIPGDAAGLVALAEAARIVRRDAADVMVVGSSEGRLNPITLSRYNLFLELSKRNDDPPTPSAVRRHPRRHRVRRGAAVFTSKRSSTRSARGERPRASWSGGPAAWTGKKGPGLARVIRNALARGRHPNPPTWTT
jgi:3-oxoacyl-[acyl-carrier-protein] synthase II